MWDVNVKSSFFLIQECKEMLIESINQKGAGNILVISSVTGTHP
jgi:NAD(P)-dependent dehydrogenase (short-subunit alcohol dehydrogenase family)